MTIALAGNLNDTGTTRKTTKSNEAATNCALARHEANRGGLVLPSVARSGGLGDGDCVPRPGGWAPGPLSAQPLFRAAAPTAGAESAGQAPCQRSSYAARAADAARPGGGSGGGSGDGGGAAATRQQQDALFSSLEEQWRRGRERGNYRGGL